ncbi:MAG: pyridoxal phosphate-dependent aminotransferase [Mesosutterella sp.]|nr:pyridoxal phosphate-dependent aminotransferase [Mesosutterella sp.]
MTLKHNFDEVVDRTHTNSSKWLKYPKGVLPLWIADTDFKCPQPVIDEMIKIAQHGIYGYPYVQEGSFEKATVRWCKVRYDWDITESMVDFVPSTGTALAVAVKAFCEPGDKVLMQTPIYPPFTAVTVKNRCYASNNPLKFVNGRWEIDWEDFEARAKDPKCKLFMLCNPHNPTGRCFTAEELNRMADICAANGVTIFADEVHSDFVFAPHKHQVFAKLSEKAKNMCVVAVNPAKTFNIAGLRTSSVVTPNPEVQKQYQAALASCKLGRECFGIAGYVKAFTECDYYADQIRDYVEANHRYVVDYITKNIPQIKAYMPDATFLLWLDCRGLPFKTQAELDKFMVEKAKLGLNPGNTFGVEGERFVRMNVASPRSYLVEAMKRLSEAVKSL